MEPTHSPLSLAIGSFTEPPRLSVSHAHSLNLPTFLQHAHPYLPINTLYQIIMNRTTILFNLTYLALAVSNK